MEDNFSKTKPYQYRGAIHIHSTFSDGTGDILEIVSAAKKAGLSWIVVTDHNNLDIQEGIYSGIYVLRVKKFHRRMTIIIWLLALVKLSSLLRIRKFMFRK